ncbi:MAG: hypothetical protein EOO43_13710, partial [Flavobacterium sp.]
MSANNDIKNSAEILLHKVIAIKEHRKHEKTPASKTLTYPFRYLLSKHQDVNMMNIFGLNIKEEDTHDISKETMKRVYLFYCQELLKRFPRNSLIKLHTAYRSIKSSEPYSKTIKIITDIQEKNTRWSWSHLSCSLLLYDLEKSIKKATNEQQQSLDLQTYIRSRVSVENLRTLMLEQTDLQFKVCQNVLSQTCNIGEIHNSAQRISDLRIFIQKKIDVLSRSLPEYYSSPFLCYAEYHLVTNNSRDNFEKYYEIYEQRYFKYQKFFKDSRLVNENLYQHFNASLLISIQKPSDGKILYYTKPLTNLCGAKDIKFVSSIFPVSLREYYDELFKSIGEQDVLDKIHKAYFYNSKDKYLTEANFCLKYHPYLTQGLCLNMIIRPFPSNTEFLLLAENGDIEGASKEISKLLGLHQKITIPVKRLSEQLFLVNAAFNQIEGRSNEDNPEELSLCKSSRFSKDGKLPFLPISPTLNLPYEKAQEICSAITTEDQEIDIYPLDKMGNDPYKFYARVQVEHYRNIIIRRVALRAIDPNQERDSIESSVEIEKAQTTLNVFDLTRKAKVIV